MRVTYELTEENYRRFYKLALARHSYASSKLFRTGDPYLDLALLYAMTTLCLCLLFSLVVRASDGASYSLPFALLVGVGYYSVERLRAGSRARRMFYELGVGGEYTVEITPEGLDTLARGGNSFVFWEYVSEVVEDDHCVYLFTGATDGCMVPKSAFSSREEAATFSSSADSFWKGSRSRWWKTTRAR